MHWHRTATERARALSVRSTALSKLSSVGARSPGLGCESPEVCWHAVSTGGASSEEASATDAGGSDVLCAELTVAASEVQAAPGTGSGAIGKEEVEVEAGKKDWGGVMQLLGRWKSLMEHNKGSCQSWRWSCTLTGAWLGLRGKCMLYTPGVNSCVHQQGLQFQWTHL